MCVCQRRSIEVVQTPMWLRIHSIIYSGQDSRSRRIFCVMELFLCLTWHVTSFIDVTRTNLVTFGSWVPQRCGEIIFWLTSSISQEARIRKNIFKLNIGVQPNNRSTYQTIFYMQLRLLSDVNMINYCKGSISFRGTRNASQYLPLHWQLRSAFLIYVQRLTDRTPRRFPS